MSEVVAQFADETQLAVNARPAPAVLLAEGAPFVEADEHIEAGAKRHLGRLARSAVVMAAGTGIFISSLGEATPVAATATASTHAETPRPASGDILTKVYAEHRVASITLGTQFLKYGHPVGDAVAVADDPEAKVMAVVGGFEKWYDPDGSTHAADKLALVDDRTGKLIHGGRKINSYIWNIVYRQGEFYLGGYFTSIDGKKREHLAAVSARTGQLESRWHPSVGAPVLALASAGGNIITGGFGSKVEAYNPKSGKKEWAREHGGGSVHVIKADGKDVFVGGDFSRIGKVAKYGLAKLVAKTGKLIKSFGDTHFQHPGGVCHPKDHPEWDDPCDDVVLSLDVSEDGQKLEAGVGGIRNELVIDSTTGKKREKMYHNVGDVQAVVDIDPVAGKSKLARAKDLIIMGFHRNSPHNLGHPLDRFSAFVKTASTHYIKMKTALRSLSGGTSNADGNNGGIRRFLVIDGGRKLVVVGGFGGPQNGLEVLNINPLDKSTK